MMNCRLHMGIQMRGCFIWTNQYTTGESFCTSYVSPSDLERNPFKMEEYDQYVLTNLQKLLAVTELLPLETSIISTGIGIVV